ncbi:MAG: hypothetical protein KDD58_14905 [Bdellovibrionales bacterium]|nr:hypothetical protein [Bdellovibrionales bacterium]
MAKFFSLTWAFEAFEDSPTFFTKRMFGGLAAYVEGKMVLVIFENPDDREYRGKVYNFDLWNGILLPLERKVHATLINDFPELINHPVLPKWLYLPMSNEYFETTIETISSLIAKNDPRFGIYPQTKTSKKLKKKK